MKRPHSLAEQEHAARSRQMDGAPPRAGFLDRTPRRLGTSRRFEVKPRTRRRWRVFGVRARAYIEASALIALAIATGTWLAKIL